MAYINFAIDYDFKWALLGMTLVWACSLICLGLRKRAELNDRKLPQPVPKSANTNRSSKRLRG